SQIRYQHSRIRPYFSGCGRSVADTLDEIRQGKLEPGALPPIQVLIGPDENDGLGPWYFSLNNRRLWVLKQCQKEGLLDNEKYNNMIPVRVRMPKSGAEAERYSVENCALEAKFMREGEGGRGSEKSKKKKKAGRKKEAVVQTGGDDSKDDALEAIPCSFSSNRSKNEDNEPSSDSQSESDDDVAHQNPFSALL
ncbi:hypothetical protein ACHAWF_007058, partial [Thalassiosira exigua]